MAKRWVRAFAPGRVNLIGEHTDYNDGLCLPFAIELGVSVTAAPLGAGDRIEAYAVDVVESERFSTAADLRPPDTEPAAGADGAAVRPGGDWRPFVRGAVAELRHHGVEPVPCRLEMSGDVPPGAGLSSSAALSVALCLALCAVAGAEPPERVELARLCSRIENDWCGRQTGLLDQLASLFGREGAAVRIDMRGPDIRHVDLDLGSHILATVDSGARRNLADSGYNERRRECRRAAEMLGVESLRDADPDAAATLPEPLGRRVRHVVSENQRVDDAAEALGRGDLPSLGRLLDASHESLRDGYEVSVPAVERAVEECKRAGALGARIMGGGFGGSALALFPPDAEPPERAMPVKPGPAARVL
jgi:galactokinase